MQMRETRLRLRLDENYGPLEINRMGLGQGGLSSEPMWENRVAEVRALRPRLIRFWAQEYFNPLPQPGHYHFEAIDRAIDPVLQTGATPLVSLNFKPRVLFPVVNEHIVEPIKPTGWQELVYRFARRYAEQGLSGFYWEIIGEADCGEGGGCPYQVTAENYPPFYALTVEAILQADPAARVGGPGLSSAASPVLPAWLDYCERSDIPLHFVSWHIYSSKPGQIRETIGHVKGELAKRPALQAETILDEWNMALQPGVQERDPRFQPCFIPEVTWQMKDAGLDYACYYQIRDYHVRQAEFERFFSPGGAAFMARWWNRMPQWDGLFDYQDTVRPAYFSFKLLSRLTGERLGAEADDPAVHAFLTYDREYQLYNLMFWNFAASPVKVRIEGLDQTGLAADLTALPFVLDAAGASNDENRRICQEQVFTLAERPEIEVECQPYGVHFWYLMNHKWAMAT